MRLPCPDTHSIWLLPANPLAQSPVVHLLRSSRILLRLSEPARFPPLSASSAAWLSWLGWILGKPSEFLARLELLV